MIKFRVQVHGRHFRLLLTKKRWFRPAELISKPVGFYTTRFVEAPSANQACEKVFENLRTELFSDDRITEESVLELEGVWEDEAGFDYYAPGSGYTFYSEDGSMSE